jgi:hypothetical protein
MKRAYDNSRGPSYCIQIDIRQEEIKMIELVPIATFHLKTYNQEGRANLIF